MTKKDEEKARRLAAALRENLKRRKAQARSIPPQNGEGDRPPEADGGGGPGVLQSPIRTVKRARRLRREMTLPEVLLWQELRRRPGGLKFRRQFPRGSYVMDFVCLECRLGIEVDGEAHNLGNIPDRDALRDVALGEVGFRMLRIPAREVLADLEAVVTAIVEACRAGGPLHQTASPSGPPPRSGED